ncbi:hypothetical protein A2697_03945 [Candidatus Curtissbacteria bacterium RIFCSPHIGHO2_01_FULL_41_44]|uniref:EamA domain-containing protein n=1 Tax=Candidatus Curtissbacteria bacterium RIFCSPLOWO2_01_FULL_42_50 TaxID=1797730 RepID=A0A1F5H7M9_9BACT|nr:MAG: hypothetical protein A2697_03945 [Candidatus Curtissbacteria bacterium RIFCSPHIGHO2_01_FULL_41_44]OGD94319.1 MAG: hypothetical protein A3C33_03110 [Candidatus Curtissbacteria bacterium RIFCSPHIGHO2_02_FULL_42_58]OGD97793.1 MAG: hypothetical protein A3E71_03620 [Candidatus Curtissbacteria bacterium RIFCSPHIGHO2_12_FULL_42_33]OGE00184.1 MAG: hypothetical protein A3B54_02160 [Candidatus Curtissbacteria bacterium RIFCSPLOWO2_01_FULL_42_50]OGE02111.1 MAG: hypothetical protein A3G16_00475 [Ca
MKPNPAFFYTVTAAVIWGATAPIMKLTLAQIPVFSLAFIRMAVASLILGILIAKKLKIEKADYATFFWAAITGVTLNLAFFFLGLKLTQAILAAFLVASVPVFTLFAAHFYLKEKFNLRLIIASVIAMIGVIIIIGKFDGGLSPKQLLGNLLLFAATLSWVAHEIIAKKLLKVYQAGVVAFYSMAVGAATFFPLFLWEFWRDPTWIGKVDTSGFLGLLYGIFFASLAAYWAWQQGLKLLPAGQAAFFFYLDPVSGAILSMILLGERLTSTLAIGGILIIIGVFLAEHKRQARQLDK